MPESKDGGQPNDQEGPSGLAGTGPVGKGEFTVAQGQCIKSIAVESGIPWQKIWYHPDNTELRDVRKEPNILLPGDRLVVPLIELREYVCQTEKRHTFQLKGMTTRLKLVLKDNDKPRKNEPYTLTVDGRLKLSGTTDSKGAIQHDVPATARSGELIVGSRQDRYRLDFSHLDPIDELSGVQGRLNNLGFHCGPADGIMSPRTAAAIQAFQNRCGLSVTGKPDQATRDKLKQEYGS